MVTYFTFHGRQVGASTTLEKLSDDKARLLQILLALQGQLGLTRRCFRTFRFLDAFHSAYRLAFSRSVGSMPLVMVLDTMARTFNGMYLLLETATLIDAMKIEGLRLLTPDFESFLKIESQRSWFLALVSGGLSCAVALHRDRAEKASLKRFLEDGLPEKDENDWENAPPADNSSESMSPPRRVQVNKRIDDLDRRRFALTRKLMANCFDLALPGSVIGWIPASSGTVGLCMFLTSILTGWDVWERCGREVAGFSRTE